MTYLVIGIVVVVIFVIALIFRASRHTYHPDARGASGRARHTKLDSQERITRWNAGI